MEGLKYILLEAHKEKWKNNKEIETMNLLKLERYESPDSGNNIYLQQNE